MTLISDLIQLKAELHSIPADLGLPQYRTIAIRKAIPATAAGALEGEEVLVDYILDPPCFVSRAPAKYVGLYLSEDTVIEAQVMVVVKNLPRTFSRRFLEVNVQAYILDPVLNEQGVITSGLFCKLLDVIDERTLSWKVVLMMKSDREFATVNTPAGRITSDA